MISRDMIDRLSQLSKITVEEEEVDSFVEKLHEVTEYFKKLNELDLEGVEPTLTVNDFEMRLREDEPTISLPKYEAIKNAVDEQYGYFKLVKTVK